MPDPVVSLQVQVFRDIEALLESLTPEEWALPTECPGWSVQDNVSHIIGTESMILGREAPAHDPGDKAWVRNPIGANNEIQVDYRRSWAPGEVLDEYREVTSERIRAIEAMSDEDLAADSWTPVGPGTVRDLIAVRIMDCWVHEQDIRRAVGKPGGLDTDVAAHAFGRHRSAIPFVVGKKVGAPDGTTVVMEVAGQPPFAVGVEGKRANLLGDIPIDPDVRMSMDLQTFNRLCCGRGDPDAIAKDVTIEGDEDLGRRVLTNQNFMI